MYELYIKNNNEWHLADLGNDRFAINFVSNDIAELSARWADYSQEIRLPVTTNNAFIFDYAHIGSVITDSPYKVFECRLYSDGFTIAGKGALIRLLRITDEYICQIASGNSDFFEKLKNSKMADLDLGYIKFDESMLRNSSNECMVMPLATFVRGGEPVKVNEYGMPVMEFEKTYPCLKIKYIIEEMIKSHGYTIEHNLPHKWEKLYISLCNINSHNDSLNKVKASAEGYITGTYRADLFIPFTTKVDPNNYLTINSTDVSSEERYVDFISSSTGLLNINYGISGYDSLQNKLPQNAIEFKIENLSSGFTKRRLGWGYLDNFTMEVSKGDKIRAYIILKKTNQIAIFTLFPTVEYTYIQSNEVPRGGRLYYSPNLGFENQIELFKTFVQLFGLTVKVDNHNKIVYAYTMDKIYKNKSAAIDWSGKTSKVPTQTFSLGSYGQTNTIKFEEDKSDNIADIATFNVLNENLVAEKELFTIPIESGREYPQQLYTPSVTCNIPNIPLLEIQKEVKTTYTFKGTKPHILEFAELKQVVIDKDGYQITYHLMKHCHAQNFVDEFYNKLTNGLLKRARIYESRLLLTPLDIHEFNSKMFTPVFIDELEGYFYVNKIKNFGANDLTECELIKL